MGKTFLDALKCIDIDNDAEDFEYDVTPVDTMEQLEQPQAESPMAHEQSEQATEATTWHILAS